LIQLKPNDAIGYNNRAWNYHLAGRDAEGLSDANQAVSLAPNDAGTIETRAEIFEKLGQRDKAIVDYRSGCYKPAALLRPCV
jgi:tetratricopeptide (TPR) repeat protein